MLSAAIDDLCSIPFIFDTRIIIFIGTTNNSQTVLGALIKVGRLLKNLIVALGVSTRTLKKVKLTATGQVHAN